MEKAPALQSTHRWIKDFVVSHQLCPFAAKPLQDERIRLVESQAENPDELMEEVQQEVHFLLHNPPEKVETSVLVHPHLLNDFHAYLDFVELAEIWLEEIGWEADCQLAGFHPDYQFAETEADDPENWTNRSPFPMIHLLRGESVEKAVAGHPDIERVPLRNIELMKSLGKEMLRKSWKDFHENAS
ncbi:MAG: DUF1415 domain-containing protein [Bacteroidota bacterium]